MSGKERNSAPLEITPAVILEVARKIVKPYTLDFKYLDWWSKYKVSFDLTEITPVNTHVNRSSKESPHNLASPIGM